MSFTGQFSSTEAFTVADLMKILVECNPDAKVLVGIGHDWTRAGTVDCDDEEVRLSR